MSSEEIIASVPAPSGIERTLENARVLIEDRPWIDNPQKYRKTAEAILRRVLTFDPGNEAAKALLAKAEVPLPQVQAAPPEVISSPLSLEPTPPRPLPREDSLFVAQTTWTKPEEPPTKSPVAGWIGIGAVTVIAGFLVFGFLSSRFHRDAPKPTVAQPSDAQVPAEVLNDAALTIPEPIATTPLSQPSVPAPIEEIRLADTNLPAATVEVKASAPAVAPIQTGTLAVSSPTTADIYLGEKFLGSAPATIELPAGTQQLEYRHLNMRKVVAHEIKPNETTTAMVTFDVPVQINARPWAQVFIEGSQRQPLGQTPLSDVRVPIGSLLVFENPNFQGKSYRVTGRETEIRMTFP